MCGEGLLNEIDALFTEPTQTKWVDIGSINGSIKNR